MSNQPEPKIRVIQLKKLQTNIDEELHDALRIMAIERKMNIREIVEDLILQAVIKNAKRDAKRKQITEIVD